MVKNKKKIIVILLTILFGGLVIFFYLLNPAKDSYFVSCPIKFTTGFYCPGCGSQRAIHELLHGNFKQAIHLNPLMIISLPIILYGLGITAWNFIFESHLRVKLFYNNLFVFGYFGVVVLYWILRNLPYYPFNLLAPSN